MSRRLSGAPPELGPEALEQIERELRESRRSARVAAIEPLEEGGAEGLAVFGPEDNPAALALVAGNEEEQGLDPAQELNSEESEVDSVLSDLLDEFLDCEEASDPPLAFTAVVGAKAMASSSGVAEMIGTRASVGSILVILIMVLEVMPLATGNARSNSSLSMNALSLTRLFILPPPS